MKICMAVYVFGKYTRYIPYYIYSILKSYPDYYVKVYVKETLSVNENKSLALIRNHISSNFEVIENYMDTFHLKSSKMVGGAEKIFRFLLPYEELKDFEYAYIGDVDFLIIQEIPSLLDGHKEHAKQVGVPYSNAIRPRSKRLTGLHFINVKEYYNKMEPLIKEYLKNPNMLYNEVKKFKYNEEFLYHIIEKGIGFGKIHEHHYRPPHGFHIGVGRQGNDEEKKRKIDRYLQQKQLRKQGIFQQLSGYFDDPVFKEIMALSPDKSVELLRATIKEL